MTKSKKGLATRIEKSSITRKKRWQRLKNHRRGYLAYKLQDSTSRHHQIFCGQCGLDMREDAFKAHVRKKHNDQLQL